MAEIGAGFVVNGVVEILKSLVPAVAQSIAGAWGFKSDLQKLRNTLETIEAVIADAEERQANDVAVRLWMKRLKDAAYDAEDILDDYAYQAMRKSDEMRSKRSKVRNLGTSSNRLIFPMAMAFKIKNINFDLDAIAKDMHDFSFRKAVTSNNTVYQIRNQLNRKSVSLPIDLEIVGREHDKSEILKLLFPNNNNNMSSSSSSSSSGNSFCSEKTLVISIVGMGGIGKTALAQLVYNDESVMKHFDSKIWICVSDVFDIYKVLRNIMEFITDNKCDKFINEDVLVRKVQKALKDKKYFVVLDDLWNQNIDNWETLKSWLNVGAHGSKILITTRLQQVASIAGGMISSYPLQKLSHTKCWSIIEKKAFSPGGASETGDMINLGMMIAKKCCGLPIVANSLGGLMHSKPTQSDWLSIKNKDIWASLENHGDVIPVIKLNYDNLPSHLRQCFSYCALFPKGFVIPRKILIRLWMAEGFLPSFDDERIRRPIEDIGNEYFESLLWSSLFQDVKMDELGNIETCKMHDLVHDLARNVVGEHECSTDVKVIREKANVSDIRRLLLVLDKEAFPETLHNLKKLRTIIDLGSGRDCMHLKSFFSNKQLRVLQFKGTGHINLPSSESKLRHLRYLDLSNHCASTYGNLSESISSFYNLQTLVLHKCVNFEYLPRNIGSLINLRHLDVSFTQIQVLPDSITSLCNLRTFKFHNCSRLKELPIDFGKLKHLGSLNLEGTGIEVLPKSCSDNLRDLEIVHLGDKCKLPKDIKNWKRVRHLTHRGGSDVEMPRGIEQLTSLQILHSYVVRKQDEVTTASDHRRSSGIEVFSGLNLLEQLKIKRLENVRRPIDADRANLKGKANIRKLILSWGSEDGKNCSDHDVVVLEALQPHPNLKELWIENFIGSKLPTWMGGISSCLSNLVNLRLIFCSRSKQLPALGQLPHLTYLHIQGMVSVKGLGDEFYYHVGESSEDVTTISSTLTAPSQRLFFPSLMMLNLQNMESLEEWVTLVPRPPLSGADLVSKFPVACSFPLLEKMEIFRCKKLTITPTTFPSLKDLRLLNSNGEALNSIARGLTSLTSLVIQNLPELIYFPGGLLRNNNCLQYLFISNCKNFQGFQALDGGNTAKDDEAAPSGTKLNSWCSLQSLEFEDCPVLKYLPDLQDWTTLRRLRIYKCNGLKKCVCRRCLSFIKYLDVDFLNLNDLHSQSSRR